MREGGPAGESMCVRGGVKGSTCVREGCSLRAVSSYCEREGV